MEPQLIAWLVGALLSVISLAKLMRGRQAKLTTSLRTYVEVQLEWARKRAKAARLARKMARQKAAEEAKQAAILAESGAAPGFEQFHEQQKAA